MKHGEGNLSFYMLHEINLEFVQLLRRRIK